MEEDSAPLLDGDGGEEGSKSTKNADSSKKEGSPKLNLKNMVLFHGKELSGKSFIRSPHYNLVRIGVGKDGIYKLDGVTSKVLAHWKFKEVRDSSYSGFSFTLQFKGGKSDYSVRTDDGEAICSYIESFQKNPDKALEQARSNPPVSKVPEQGLMTLRRKFSGDPKNQQAPAPEVRFYTLNRRSNKKSNSQEFSSRTVPNIEVDSRLKGSPSVNGDRRSYSFDQSQYHSASDVRSSNGGSSDHRINGSVPKSASQDRLLARAVLSQRIKQAEQKEKRMSNGSNLSPPISTRGEVTATLSTKATPTDPPQTNKRWSSNSPHLQRKPPPIPDHVTGFNKAGSAPPCLPPEEGGEVGVASSISKAQGIKQLNNIGKQHHSPSKSDHTPSEERAPLLKRGDSSEGSEFSEYVSSGGGEGQAKPPVSGTSSLNRYHANYDNLEEFIRKCDSWETFSPESSPAPPPSSSSSSSSSLEPRPPSGNVGGLLSPESAMDVRVSDASSDESGTYDHLPILPASPPSSSSQGAVGVVTLGAPSLEHPRRNISQPALSASARDSSCDQFGRFGSIDEESSDEDMEGATPTNSDEEGRKEESKESVKFVGVKLRPKKHQELIEDPFADLMSPKASGRLRWSQELNPLYDYIKGFKADGVKLYDQSPLSKRATGGEGGAGGKPPSMILEDESEQGSVVSCSDDLQSICSSSTLPLSPTSPAPSLGEGGEDIPREGSFGTRSRRPQLHMYEDVQPHPRKPYYGHNYEDITAFAEPPSPSPSLSPCSMPASPSPISIIMDGVKRSESAVSRSAADRQKQKQGLKSSTVLDTGRYHEKVGVSPRLGKRQIIQQRRSRTLHVHDDTETLKTKQRPVKVADALKDFSFVMREYRLFYVKLPNGFLSREIFSINKPVSELREKLCDYLGVDPERYQLSVEGACLSTLREGGDSGAAEVVRVNKAGLSYLMDSHVLADQGPEPIYLQSNLSFRMQGISTSRILALSLLPDLEGGHNDSFTSEPPSEEDEFHKCWISVVQGNHPLTMENAIKLAALQYQAYFLDRTAVNSVVGFSRPTEFLPVEYANTRGVEPKMYKEQESLLKKTHDEIEEDYIGHCSQLETYGAVFFPAREPRKKLLQSTKLKPVIFGVGPQGILRVDPKTKELLGFWQYNVLKNWAYSKRTFVLAFRDKSFPIESNQSKWISSLVDFFVDSIMINSATGATNLPAPTHSPTKK